MWRSCSEPLAQPASDLAEVAVGAGRRAPLRMRHGELEMCELRVDQEAGRHCEGRALGLVRQTAEAERTADARGAVEDLRCELGDAGELRRAACDHDARLRLRREG